ncbi:GNAT family N-acetyltransferase [soil metagenome]
MKVNLDDVIVTHNEAAQRFETELEGQLGVVAYQRRNDTLFFTHTEVPDQFQGLGVAGKLAHSALEYARDNHLTIVPLCSYMVAYVRRHPEYQTLVGDR